MINKAREASRLVDHIYKYSEENGYIRILKDRPPFIHYSRFKEYINKFKGIDKSTVYSYRDLLKAFKFIEIDEFDRVFFVFRSSKEYISADKKGGLNLFIDD